MLSRYDDYPIHQTPEPIAHPATGDRNVYDRYWFNGYTDDGEFYFAIALAVYPNRQVIDCAFSVVRGGEQHAFHASSRAPRERAETVVGPFRLEIVEPMRTMRVVLEDNETGIACDLTFSGRTASIQEGRQTLRAGTRVSMDATRFNQFGRWSGQIRYAGQTVHVDPERVYGTKDRSWGVRPVGEPEGGAPPTSPPQFFFLWAPLQWGDMCTHMGVFEDGRGVAWHQDGMICPSYASAEEVPGVEDPGVEILAGVGHELVYEPGTRRASSGRLRLDRAGGESWFIELEPLLLFRMKGIGYSHPEWGHGRWQGELRIGGEAWKCDDLDPMALENQHIQQVIRVRMGERVGIGAMEQICFGPHLRYGFKDVLDPAR